MLERILPSSVRWSHFFEDRLDVELFPEERAVVADAVPRRQAEFTTVRACAREVLAALGHAPVPLLPGAYGAPGWPDGVVGSMTHCAGYRAAVVANSAHMAALGIDAEPHDALPEVVLRAIARPEEHQMLAALPTADGLAWDRLLFCAKEAVYKAWFSAARSWLGFGEATVVIAPDGTFTARLHTRGPDMLGRPLTGFDGRWAASDTLLVTPITVERITLKSERTTVESESDT